LLMLLAATGIPAECAAYLEVTARLLNTKQPKMFSHPAHRVAFSWKKIVSGVSRP
jgi:hypothetical protein